MAVRLMVVALLFGTVVTALTHPPHKYETAAVPRKDTLNVHIVPHTHDDVGWLKTVDQYYMGANNSIQHAGVRYILDSVITALEANPNRKFTYVEQAFFQRWFRQQTPEVQARVKVLVESGQLEMTNGGWCMHDEAATHYVAMIDQTTLGHRFINEQFGKQPTVGWQIDPFGHSATQAAVLSAEVGFDMLVFGRQDYQDRALRINESRMEFFWQPSPSLGSSAAVFTSARFDGNYGPLKHFCFDQSCDDPPIQDDPRLQDVNVRDRVNLFVEEVKQMADHMKGNDVMLTMGSDFQYENANTWYVNLDKIIHYVNADGRVNVFYSTPSLYAKAKLQSYSGWTFKHDDFFPYADKPHAYWTGYFTSRPTLKRYVRISSGILQVVRQLEAFSLQSDGHGQDTLEEADGIVQHHDAVSGTSKQHVANDYAKRVSEGIESAVQAAHRSLASLMSTHQSADPRGAASRLMDSFRYCPLLNLSVCPATQSLNESGGSVDVIVYNPLAQARVGQPVCVPLSSRSSITVSSVACSSNTQQQHRRSLAPSILPHSVEPVPRAVSEQLINVSGATSAGKFQACFLAPEIPAFGYCTVTISAQSLSEKASTVKERKVIINSASRDGSENITIENDILSLSFSSISGELMGMSNKLDGAKIRLKQAFLWYNSSQHDPPGWFPPRFPTCDESKSGDCQNSGAYIFRPNSTAPFPIGAKSPCDESSSEFCIGGVHAVPESFEVVKNDVYQEIQQVFSPWLTQTIRLYQTSVDSMHGNGDSAHLDIIVGSIPQTLGEGKEIVSRFSSPDIASDGAFYTDSNGREFQRRLFNFRPTWTLNVTEPVAGNYYPVNAAGFIKSEGSASKATSDVQLSVVTDRSVGAASLRSGQMEFMVHRRVLIDDSRGVVEPLNETEGGEITSYADQVHPAARFGKGLVVRTTHKLMLASSGNIHKSDMRANGSAGAMKFLRAAMDASFLEPLVTFGTKDDSLTSASHSSSFLPPLPPQLQMQTLQKIQGGKALLFRISHQFAVHEDASLSVPVTVALENVLSPAFNVTSITEMSLTANQRRSALLERRAATTQEPVWEGSSKIWTVATIAG